MRKQQESAFWSECRKQLSGVVQEAFQSLPAHYFLAAALLLPLAILAWACRLALGWAADRFVPQLGKAPRAAQQ